MLRRYTPLIMETPERSIELNFVRKDFEDIYFRDKQADIFFNPQIKNSFLLFLLVLLLFFSSIAYSLLTNDNAWLIIVLFISLSLAFYNYFIRATLIFKWRKSVIEYLDKNAQIKHHRLTLTQNALIVSQDQIETITKWTVFTKAIIDENHVSLVGTDNFLFPKKSMHAEDFEILSEIVRSRFKNGV